MGYYTKYSINGNTELIELLVLENENAAYALQDEESCKWYDHERELKEFSNKHPNSLFTLNGIGEEEGDIWRKYFFNGMVQKEEAIITFGEFDKEKLV